MVLFLLINLAVLAIYGVRHGGDTPLYLDGAQRLLDRHPLIDREPSYFGYVAIVAVAQAIGIGTTGVVLFQIALGAVAAMAVYSIGVALSGRAAGLVAAALYGLDLDTNRWHQFILADSVYISAFTIGMWLTYRAATRSGVASAIGPLLLLLAAALVRPEGWFALPAAICFIVVMRAQSAAQRVVGAGAAAVAAVILVAILSAPFSGNVQAVGPADMLQRGQTIWDFDGWRVSMPANDAAGGGQAAAAIGYALRHPFSTIKLMAARVAVHFAHVRPFYSTPHNAAIVVWLVPMYAAALYALARQGATPLAMWIVAAIATQTLVVALTHAEWDGRYLAHVLPLIDTLVGAGVGIWMASRRSSTGVAAHA